MREGGAVRVGPAGASHPRGQACAVALCAVVLCLANAAHADPIPVPQVDFALKANLRRGTIELAHKGGHMRVEITRPELPGSIIGLLDLKARRMVVRTPNLPGMALEVELPPEYALGAVTGQGTKSGTDQVAGETCDLWKMDAPTPAQISASMGPTVACITTEGIALRTEVEIKGRKTVLFEATELVRAPQDVKLFLLPPGLQVVKVPKGKLGAALGLGGPGPALEPKP